MDSAWECIKKGTNMPSIGIIILTTVIRRDKKNQILYTWILRNVHVYSISIHDATVRQTEKNFWSWWFDKSSPQWYMSAEDGQMI